MILEVCEKTSEYSEIKPLIKKGYYPGKLIEVKEWTEKDTDKPKECKWGHQLICTFAVYHSDENGKPVKPVQTELKIEGQANKKVDVELAKFVYHRYKNKEGGYDTAVTPNSQITKMFKAFGWKFDATKPLDVLSFVGQFVELNIDSYDQKLGDETYKASTIKDMAVLETQPEGKEEEKPKEEAAEDKVVDKPAEPSIPKITQEEYDKKVTDLTTMKDEGLMSEDGYKMAIEQLDKRKG